jgi:TorA maturation chaperone TorD
MDTAAYASLALVRSRLYWLLGGLFLTAPSAASLESLGRELAELDEKGPQELLPAVRQLRGGLGAGADAMAAEFSRLLGGLREDDGPAPPFESVWRESRLMGESSLAVMRCYEKAGYGLIEESAGPQDHIGVELRFLALLCHDEAAIATRRDRAALRAQLARERDFLANHLALWAPRLFAALRSQSALDYFLGMVALAEQFLELDAALIGELLDTVDAIPMERTVAAAPAVANA